VKLRFLEFGMPVQLRAVKAIRLLVLVTLCSLGLASCVTPPLNTEAVSVNLSPAEVKASPDTAKGTVVWGGVIVSSINLIDRTQLEILAYPLDRYQRPEVTKQPIGRFLLQSPDYIETENFAPGRELTAIGSLQGLTKGEVGEASYFYPTVSLNDVYLWNRDNSHEKPQFIFGIGLNIGD